MEINQISIANYKEVVELFDHYRIFYKQSSDILLAEKFIKERLSNNQSMIFVAYEHAIPIGFTQLYPSYSSVRAVKRWILNDLYVEKEYRKSGVGKALIQKALKFAKENDAVTVKLETAKDNYTAKALYESIGFELQGPDEEFDVYLIKI